MSKLMSKTILITGSSSGIGQATAYVFAKDGWNIIITYRSSKKDGELTKKECEKLGAASVLLLSLDVNDDTSIKSALSEIKRKHKTIDVLVNNAGVLLWKSTTEHSFKEIETELRTNLESLIKVSSLFVPITKQAVINISSQLGTTSMPNVAVYSASKWGVRGFTKGLAMENKNLLVLSVNPGLTATRMTDGEGVPASKVANIIFDSIAGKHKVSSGDDVNVFQM